MDVLRSGVFAFNFQPSSLQPSNLKPSIKTHQHTLQDDVPYGWDVEETGLDTYEGIEQEEEASALTAIGPTF